MDNIPPPLQINNSEEKFDDLSESQFQTFFTGFRKGVSEFTVDQKIDSDSWKRLFTNERRKRTELEKELNKVKEESQQKIQKLETQIQEFKIQQHSHPPPLASEAERRKLVRTSRIIFSKESQTSDPFVSIPSISNPTSPRPRSMTRESSPKSRVIPSNNTIYRRSVSPTALPDFSSYSKNCQTTPTRLRSLSSSPSNESPNICHSGEGKISDTVSEPTPASYTKSSPSLPQRPMSLRLNDNKTIQSIIQENSSPSLLLGDNRTQQTKNHTPQNQPLLQQSAPSIQLQLQQSTPLSQNQLTLPPQPLSTSLPSPRSENWETKYWELHGQYLDIIRRLDQSVNSIRFWTEMNQLQKKMYSELQEKHSKIQKELENSKKKGKNLSTSNASQNNSTSNNNTSHSGNSYGNKKNTESESISDFDSDDESLEFEVFDPASSSEVKKSMYLHSIILLPIPFRIDFINEMTEKIEY